MCYDTGFDHNCPVCNKMEGAHYLRKWGRCKSCREMKLNPNPTAKARPKTDSPHVDRIPIVIADMPMTLIKY